MDGLCNIEMLGIKNACSMKKMMMIIKNKKQKKLKEENINMNIKEKRH